MSRNMIMANTEVFRRLVTYCQDRGLMIENPNAARWVHANPGADQFLKHLNVRRSISFGRFRHLAWLDLENRHYLATVGYEHEPGGRLFLALEDVQGFDVCLLSELPVQPNVSPLEVINVVTAGSKEEKDYIGHDNQVVMGLFPKIHVFEFDQPMSDDVIWSTFLEICVSECRYGGSWIDKKLADSLIALAQLNVPSLPYHELCRSVLDLDPRSLYMSLYRCIEATYAFEKASKLATALSVKAAWNEIAAMLEKEMSWRPPEAQSLNVALEHAQENDLLEVCDCLGVELGHSIRASAGGAIYKLRNQIVHYRPTKTPLDFESIDWNRICNSLVTISMDVFYRAYS